MITITRQLARTLRSAVRKALDLRSHSLLVALQLQTGNSGLVVRAQTTDVALQYHEPGTFSPGELTFPLHLLKEIEGSKAEPVQLALDAKGRITGDWQEGAVPKTFSVEAIEPGDVAFPAEPKDWIDADPAMVQAFAHAHDSVDPGSSRYALGCVQLRGKDGSITATDGHHLLKQSGFQFPFDDEVLVHPNKLFGSKEFAGCERVQLARSNTHVVFRIGSWTIFLAIAKEGRFPRVDDVIPRYSDAPTIVTLAAADREFLAANLHRLPGDSEPHRDITLDVNGKVAIRAKCGEDAATELVLCHSRKTGPDMQLATNRQYLQRVAELGLDQLYVFGQDRPVLARDERRSLVWMLLDKSCIVSSSPETRQVLSSSVSSPSPRFSTTVPMRKRSNISVAAPSEPAPTTNNSTPAPVALSLLDQAMHLRTSLCEVLNASNSLVRAIKRQKKQDRAYKTALASLRQLQEAA